MDQELVFVPGLKFEWSFNIYYSDTSIMATSTNPTSYQEFIFLLNHFEKVYNIMRDPENSVYAYYVLCLYDKNNISEFECIGLYDVEDGFDSNGNYFYKRCKLKRNFFNIGYRRTWYANETIVFSGVPFNIIFNSLEFINSHFKRLFSNSGEFLGLDAINIQLTKSSSDRVALGDYSIAIGNDTKAAGFKSIALGYQATALADNAISILGTVETNATYGVAIGQDSQGKGQHCIALGSETKASSDYSIAIGYKAEAKKEGVAIGNKAFSEVGGLAIGNNAQALVPGAVALGSNAVARYPNTMVFSAYPTIGQPIDLFGSSSYLNTKGGVGTTCVIRTYPVVLNGFPAPMPRLWRSMEPYCVSLNTFNTIHTLKFCNITEPQYFTEQDLLNHNGFEIELPLPRTSSTTYAVYSFYPQYNLFVSGIGYFNYSGLAYLFFPNFYYSGFAQSSNYDITLQRKTPIYFIDSIYFCSWDIYTRNEPPIKIRFFCSDKVFPRFSSISYPEDYNSYKNYITDIIVFNELEPSKVYPIPLPNPRKFYKQGLYLEIVEGRGTIYDTLVRGEFIINLVLLG